MRYDSELLAFGVFKFSLVNIAEIAGFHDKIH
jgi:hypothetical protein